MLFFGADQHRLSHQGKQHERCPCGEKLIDIESNETIKQAVMSGYLSSAHESTANTTSAHSHDVDHHHSFTAIISVITSYSIHYTKLYDTESVSRNSLSRRRTEVESSCTKTSTPMCMDVEGSRVFVGCRDSAVRVYMDR